MGLQSISHKLPGSILQICMKTLVLSIILRTWTPSCRVLALVSNHFNSTTARSKKTEKRIAQTGPRKSLECCVILKSLRISSFHFFQCRLTMLNTTNLPAKIAHHTARSTNTLSFTLLKTMIKQSSTN